MSDATFDVFISFGHQDAAWVHALADNLHRLGLNVFLGVTGQTVEPVAGDQSDDQVVELRGSRR
jgi:hypothetical protein